MAADVGGDDVIVAAQILGHPVPVAAVVAPAVQQDQRRGLGVAPVGVVQAKALRDEGLRRGADEGVGHENSCPENGALRIQKPNRQDQPGWRVCYRLACLGGVAKGATSAAVTTSL